MVDNWVFEYARPLCLLDVDIFGVALLDNWSESVYHLGYSCKNYKFVNGRQYRRTSDITGYTKTIEQAFNKNVDFLQEFADRTFIVCEILSRKSESFLDIKWNLMSKESLENEWVDFCKVLLPVATGILMSPKEFIQERVFDILESLRTNAKLDESTENLIAIINNAVRPLAYRDEPLDLLHIGSTIQENPTIMQLFKDRQTIDAIMAAFSPTLKATINEHIRNYSWLNLPYTAYRKPFSMSDYVERLRHLVTRSSCNNEITRINDLRTADQKRFKDLLELAKSKEEANLIQATQDFTYLQTYMDVIFDHALIVVRDTLLSEVGSRLGLSDPQIASMTMKEIRDSINSDVLVVLPDQLKARINGFGYVIENNQTILITGNNVLSYDDASTQEEVDSESKYATLATGMIANEGIAIGPVRILLDPTDNSKVVAGDIIITSMTTPEYISAMEKAAAFVTDEGGVICHAAIHSREFGVPCIVGTGKATKIFKDNEIVRVDAYTGIIQKL